MFYKEHKNFLPAKVLTFVICLYAFNVKAQANNETTIQPEQLKPAISIIIDDLGYRLKSGKYALDLPGPVTYAFLPHTPHAKVLSEKAHLLKKEIMLHLPMEADGGKILGPGGLTQCMTKEKFKKTLTTSLESIPHVKGFNNHMGSYLTKSPLWMNSLMQEVAEKDVYFVDSKTTSQSVALRYAKQKGVSHIERDIFLDNDPDPEMIRKQLDKLIRKSQRRGYALAIAHPKPNSIKVLMQWLPKLDSMGVKLVPVSELIRLKEQRRYAAWKPK